MFSIAREEANEIADAKILVHDSHRFEVKLDIDLSDGDSAGYRVDTYFFVPSALNITPNTYAKTRFYGSMQRYIRFKTPAFSLPRLVDPREEASPLFRIRKGLDEIAAGRTGDERVDAVFRETKMLGAITRGAVRDEVKRLLAALEDAGGEAGAREANDGGLALAAQIQAYLLAVEDLRHRMLAPSVPLKLREAFLFFDEFTSLTVEDYLAALLQAVRERADPARPFAPLDAALSGIIVGQQQHRRRMGYASAPGREESTATLPYRRGILKKFILNVLYLSAEVSEWEAVSQVPLAVAASAAMLFAVIVTLFAQNRFATNSLPFVAVVVLSYALKDRLKDWLKLFFSKGLVKWTADRKIRIRDPHSGRVIGALKEAFSFATPVSLPEEVRRCRRMDNITSIDEEGKPERIIKYEKEVRLFPNRVFRFHQRRRDLNDIMRMNIDDFVRQADDPTVEYLHLDPATGVLQRTCGQRVYHVNMVFAYRSLGRGPEAARLERFRLVLNRNGIVKLEVVADDGLVRP